MWASGFNLYTSRAQHTVGATRHNMEFTSPAKCNNDTVVSVVSIVQFSRRRRLLLLLVLKCGASFRHFITWRRFKTGLSLCVCVLSFSMLYDDIKEEEAVAASANLVTSRHSNATIAKIFFHHLQKAQKNH